MNFSVLMSIYNREKAEYFDKCMQSIWDKQSIKPTEIVLVEDGKLTNNLYKAIQKWKNKLGNKLKIIPLEKNLGLAQALNEGLKYCSYDIIARMDTDDIATSQRFEHQLDFLQKNPEVDVVGTYIQEINEKDIIIKQKVKFPLTHDELFKFFAKRDPLAHPTAMFRSRFFQKAGFYRNDLYLAEDTLLWFNGFKNGCQFANIDYIGLQFRRSSSFYKRRANIKKSLQLLKYRLFVINRQLNYGIDADIFAIMYFFMALMPSFVKKLLYDKMR